MKITATIGLSGIFYIMKNIDELMEISVDNLAKKQFDALKSNTLSILERITRLIRDDRFDDVKEMLSYSQAGDCMGDDNHYIQFYNDMDLEEAVTKLSNLKEISE